ncbi:LuxR family maltose regulon positive regulatory protein [Paenibacillus endophyticus]|uniref:LuxR family maltose regulon positive regulatory protein n=1 Tax=Paenibacillus endophyticus TaxID=1294268 RepID=A0A7W5C5J0_9BACL|nr:LuxR C-terminal-related transcriptional regulator [Paenibacillus endophyticus]MBB3151438.1 LuxR family maltose regulon positive regulatory protein [Paenibacillus endophyticus]
MNIPIISTKLYIPPQRLKAASRSRLIERLNEGLPRKLTLISASAGFGKTTLATDWLATCKQPAAWLSLDEADNDPARFFTYVSAALQTVGVHAGAGLLAVLQSPQLPPIESILVSLLNEIALAPHPFIFVLDDYHVIDAPSIEHAIAYLIEHMPPQMHLVIASRHAPRLPLARLRASGQLTELSVQDMRFTSSEATGFLTKVMGLKLSPTHISQLETKTEGWIAGLQLAAISLQGHNDAAGFIQSFTGSHRFVLDYLIEEVLERQSPSIQRFLLSTAILERMCGSLCDAVLSHDSSAPQQHTLEELERANLFIVPLDNEGRWYRYHHLFADLLRKRLTNNQNSAVSKIEVAAAELHTRASIWYENHGLDNEAFHHAAAAGDMERAARLVEGAGMPLHFRGAAAAVRRWLESLPAQAMNEQPSLWVTYASVLLFDSQINGVEAKLRSAEAALRKAEPNAANRDLIGHIASIRATLAVSQHDAEAIMNQSLLALDNLHPDNLPVRTATTFALGYAYQLQGDRAAARQAYIHSLSTSEEIGHFIISIMAAIGLGSIQEADNQLYLAAQSYRKALQLAGDPPLSVACEAHLGLARVLYEWNDLAAAEQHAIRSVELAKLIERSDRFVASEVLLARVKLAQGDAAAAAAIAAHAAKHHFEHQTIQVAGAQVLGLLRQGNLAEAERLAQTQDIPVSQARVLLAKGNTAAALALLERLLLQAEAKGWQDERLQVMVLQSAALYLHGDTSKAISMLRAALAIAEPEGFMRIFIDEGQVMAALLAEAAAQGGVTDYGQKLLTLFDAGTKAQVNHKLNASARTSLTAAQPLVEPLSEREMNVLHYIALGLSNREISERLFLALSTVKGYNRIIFDKLQVERRTEAVARARELGLL